MKNPTISVVMPVGKERRFLKSALVSIRKQTFQSFELLLGENEEGSITRTLNNLAKKAKGEFLARMDADDICEPGRFKKQIEFLKKNPRVQLVGTSATLIDEQGKTIGVQDMPATWEEIKRVAFFKNPLIHPSLMMRREWFEKIGGYNVRFKFSQDWELLLRTVWKFRIGNIQEPLIQLRIHKDSSSFLNNREQVWYGIKSRWEAVRRRNVSFWKLPYLVPSLFSLIIPANLKYLYRKRR